MYGERCYTCHGVGAVSGGQIADLRYSARDTYEMLEAIIREGAYQPLGMPMFEFLTTADIAAIRAYLLAERQRLIDSL